MKIGITGAGGFVGSVLTKELVALGHEVKGLLHQDDFPLKDIKYTKVIGDVLDAKLMMDFFSDVDIAIHTAALISLKGDPTGIVTKVNVQGPKHVVAACLAGGVKRLVHFSSIHAMNAHPQDKILDESRELVEEDAFKYDQSKANGEREVLKGVEKGLDAVIICPTGIFGPYDAAPSPVGQHLLDLYHRRLPALITGAYDFVDIRDIVSGAITSMEKGVKGEKYLLSGHYITIKDFAGTMEKVTEKKAPRLVFPSWVQWIGLPFITLISKITCRQPIYTNETIKIFSHGENIRNTKARKGLGYEPHSIEESMQAAFKWFGENGQLK